MYTTLNKIREHHPCKDGWEKLLEYLGKTAPDDEPLSLLTILDSNGLDHTLWCFRAVDGFEKEKLLLGVTYAREVEHLMPAESKKSLDVFERYAKGLATEEEFDAARGTALGVARAASDAAAQTSSAAAAYAAASAAYAASRTAASDAACAARVAAAEAAEAAAAAWHAYSTIEAKQEAQLRQLLERTK